MRRTAYHLNLDLIADRMAELKLAPVDLARRLRITPQAVYNLLHGLNRVSPDRAKRIARALRCSWRDIILEEVSRGR